MKTSWSAFWQRYPTKGGGDLFKQVGKTVGGKPITTAQLQSSIDTIVRNLELNELDVLLDLCCGNGLLTCQLASRCKHVVGVDFSVPLIEQARVHCSGANITYHVHDIKKLDTLQSSHSGHFTKVLLNEAIAYLDEDEVHLVLQHILRASQPSVIIMIGGILDEQLKWCFFNTWRRRLYYLICMKLLRREFGLGRWWSLDRLAAIAREVGLSCEFLPQASLLHTAHYRKDAVLRPHRDIATS